ncbi:MAG: nucleotide exchange factor GrpE [Patescibacteria group bacterium]|nr:nucleotide exchange factor GrpE [Patescibacteria group bacterium]
MPNNDDLNENNNSQSDGEFLKIKKERDEYLDGWQRARAELINYKKDEMKRFELIAKFSNESLIRDLITVLDSFSFAILALESQPRDNTEQARDDAHKKQFSSDLKGVYLIKSQLEDILKNCGLEKLSVSEGQNFDPSIHEAVAEVESDYPSGIIVEEIEKGYILNGKVIRPSRVKIAK